MPDINARVQVSSRFDDMIPDVPYTGGEKAHKSCRECLACSENPILREVAAAGHIMSKWKEVCGKNGCLILENNLAALKQEYSVDGKKPVISKEYCEWHSDDGVENAVIAYEMLVGRKLQNSVNKFFCKGQ